MAFTIKSTPSVVFEVPRDSSARHLVELRRTFSSEFSIRNEIPEIHQLTVEWNEGAIESAKNNVLAILRDWEGERPQQFMIVFTNSSGDRLVEIVSATYSIENGKVEMRATECPPELYGALTGSDVLERLPPLIKKQQSNCLPEAVVRSKPLSINSMIRSMNFKSFENNLDGPPTICKYDVSQKSMPEALGSISSITQKMLLIQKEDQGPYKILFTLPQEGKVTVRTTRMQGWVSFKSKNLGGVDVNTLLDTIKEQQFRILNLATAGRVINSTQ